MSNNKHQEYLQQIPSDWEKVTIEQLGTIHSGGTPSRLNESLWNGSIAWVTPGEITNLNSKWLTETQEYITALGLSSSSAKLMPKGTILVTTRATIGTVKIAAIPICTNQGFKSIVPNEFTDSVFYCYLFDWIKSEIVRLSSGSTFNEISRRDFIKIVVPRPPIQEQQRIAEILDTLDETIAHTTSIIAKLKQIKAGLLHDLLTRGLDENGELRDAIAHPEHFKDSPLGRIPKDWNVETLAGLAVGRISNGFFKKPELVGSGYCLINVLDLYQDFGINLDLVERVNASEKEYRKYSVNQGDCFFTRSSLNLAGIAHCNIIRDLFEPALFECHLMRVRPNTSKIMPEFLAHYCSSNFARKFLMSRAKQVTMTTISQPDISPLLVPIPSKYEQENIVKIIDTHDTRIREEEAYLEKLKLQKKGLMHDLLTGKVRVNQINTSASLSVKAEPS